jgi:hypothetical protein
MTGVDTSVVYSTVSKADGFYTFLSLPTGAYRLESTVSGFQTYVQNGIQLRVNHQVQINISMRVGSVAERVEVNANPELVQTQQNTISQVVDQQRIVDLPLNGHDPTQLITISGASTNHSDGTNTGSKSFFSSQSISIAGSAGDATNYLLDGGDNNDSFTNVNMPFPFPDALAEFSVETSTLPARNGLHPGGAVNVVTKSGSNAWHGDLFEFLRNGDTNAINYFAPRQDRPPCGKVSYGIPVQSTETQYMGRMEWVVSSKHSLYGRYFLDDYTLAAFFDPHDILVTSLSGNVERAQTFVLGETDTINPST